MKGEIVLENLNKEYNDNLVVNNISLKITPGEFISLLGPSGSGKTTTLSMIAGFVQPSSGNILIDSRDVTHTSPQQRGLGMVFQNYALFPHMTVFENIAFPLKVRRYGKSEIEEKVRWALQTVQLEQFFDRNPSQLSGGQQQRVALARAIVFEPNVILMDEPLGALDKNLRYRMQTEIKELQQRLNITMIYVTHDQEEALNMSDRIAILNDGKIMQVDSPMTIYEKPNNSFVAKFLGEANLIPEGIVNKQGGNGLIFIRPERAEISVQTKADKNETYNSIKGKVTQISFLGNLIRYEVLVDSNESHFVTVDVNNKSNIEIHKVGEPVLVYWKRSDEETIYE